MLSRQFIKDNVVRFNRNVKRYMMPKKSSHITYIYAWFDELFSLALCGASPDDYFRYQFIERIGVSAENSLFGVREKNW